VDPLTVDLYGIVNTLDDEQLKEFSVWLVAELCAKILIAGSPNGFSGLILTDFEFIGFSRLAERGEINLNLGE
jgi:hypothetical protein